MNYPELSNHLVLEFWLVSTCLVVWLNLRHRPAGEVSRSFFDRMAPIARMYYLLLYAFSFIAKLNHDFLNPEVSCASYFVGEVIGAYHLDAIPVLGLVAQSEFIAVGAIWMALAFEGIIPVLLWFRKTRHWGIYTAIVFHLLMGLVPILGISSFSAFSWVLILFFFPDSTLVEMGKLIRRTMDNAFRSWLRKTVAGVIFSAIIFIQIRYIHPEPMLAIGVWIILNVPLLYLLLHRNVREVTKWEKKTPKFPSVFSWLYYSIPIFVIGTLPYLGIQTQGSFTMFSNLRILGERPNHLFIPVSWQIHQPKLIRIINTNHPELQPLLDKSERITAHELQRLLSVAQDDFFLICEYEGESLWLSRDSGVNSDHILFDAPPWIKRHFIRYKPVSSLEHNPSAW